MVGVMNDSYRIPLAKRRVAAAKENNHSVEFLGLCVIHHSNPQ